MSSQHPEQRDSIFSPWNYALPTAGELAILRDRAGLTQLDVAEQIGVNRKTIMAWEGGDSSPSIDVTRELLAIYRAEIVSKNSR